MHKIDLENLWKLETERPKFIDEAQGWLGIVYNAQGKMSGGTVKWSFF